MIEKKKKKVSAAGDNVDHTGKWGMQMSLPPFHVCFPWHPSLITSRPEKPVLRRSGL